MTASSSSGTPASLSLSQSRTLQKIESLHDIQESHAGALRLFACWCARRTWYMSHKSIEGFVKAAEDFVFGELDKEKFHEIYDSGSSGVAAVGAIGLRHDRKAASAQLATYFVTHPDPYEAAKRSYGWLVSVYKSVVGIDPFKPIGDIGAELDVLNELIEAEQKGQLRSAYDYLKSSGTVGSDGSLISRPVSNE